MKVKKTIAPSKYESVKLKKEIICLVRENKKITGVPISAFFELLAIEKLKKQAPNE